MAERRRRTAISRAVNKHRSGDPNSDDRNALLWHEEIRSAWAPDRRRSGPGCLLSSRTRSTGWRSRSPGSHFGVYSQSTAMRDYRPEVMGIATETIPNIVSGFVADSERRSTDRRSSLMREMTNAVGKHGQDFHVSPPFTAEEATPAAVELWATAEKQRLDAHELVQYEDQCRNAASEMTSSIRVASSPPMRRPVQNISSAGRGYSRRSGAKNPSNRSLSLQSGWKEGRLTKSRGERQVTWPQKNSPRCRTVIRTRTAAGVYRLR